MRTRAITLLIGVFLCSLPAVRAEGLLPDSVWTIRQKDGHHHAEQNEIWLSADRPGAGTGSEVLNRGFIQWETGFEVSHTPGIHMVALPEALLRFGVDRRAELRLEYTGWMAVNDKPDSDPVTHDRYAYVPSRLNIGSKILLCDYRGGTLDLPWLPRTALLLNVGAPLTRETAKEMPLSGSVDLLCEHEVTEWFSIGYDLGAYWEEWAPAPDVFVSLSLNAEATDRLGFFVESYNIFDPDARDYDTGARYTHCNLYLDFGLTYAVHPRVQLDAYSGISVYNTEPLLSGPANNVAVGIGVTWLIWHPHL